MSGEPVHPDSFARIERLASIVDRLACPACFAGLRLDAMQLICKGCGRVYPVINGIPVLIAEQASQGTKSNSGRG